MIVQTQREQLIHALDHLDDEQIAHLLNIVRLWDEGETQADVYEETHDVLIGFLKASPDLSSRAADILRHEFGNKPQSEPSRP